jgi:peroxiredoxin
MKFLATFAFALVLTLSVSAQKNPTFSSVGMNGEKVDSAALRGKVVVINLWFVGCPNCVEEIHKLNDLVDQYRGNSEVVFLGLAASPKADLQKFLAKNPFKYQIVPNAQMIIISKFGVPDASGNINVPFPMHYVLDRTGKVVAKAQGIKGIEDVKSALKVQIAK